MAALLLATAATAVAAGARSAADTAATQARSAATAASASALTADAHRLAAASLAASDMASAAQLAAAGFRLQDSPDTRGALLAALLRTPSVAYRVSLPERPLAMVASPTGDRVYVYEITQTIAVIDTVSRRIVGSYPARSEHLLGVIDDGRELVVNGWANSEDFQGHGRVSVLDAATGAIVRTVSTTSALDPGSPSLSPDGRWLVTVTKIDRLGDAPSRQVVVQDLADPAAPPRTVDLPTSVLAVAAGNSTVAAATASGALFLINPATLRITAEATRGDLPTADMSSEVLASGDVFAIDATGRYLAYSGSSGGVNIVPLTDPGGAGHTLAADARVVRSIGFSPDGERLAVGYDDGGVTLARTSDAAVVNTLSGHTGQVRAEVWAGGRLLTDSADRTVIGWQTADLLPLLHIGGSSVSDIGPIGRTGTIVTGITGNGHDVPYGLYSLDLRSGRQHSWPLAVVAGEVAAWPDVSQDGRSVLVSVLDGTVPTRPSSATTSSISPRNDWLPASPSPTLGLGPCCPAVTRC